MAELQETGQAGTQIEVTPEMVVAGVVAYREWEASKWAGDEYASDRDAVRLVRMILRVLPKGAERHPRRLST
jgi:hypothetical protein